MVAKAYLHLSKLLTCIDSFLAKLYKVMATRLQAEEQIHSDSIRQQIIKCDSKFKNGANKTGKQCQPY